MVFLSSDVREDLRPSPNVPLRLCTLNSLPLRRYILVSLPLLSVYSKLSPQALLAGSVPPLS